MLGVFSRIYSPVRQGVDGIGGGLPAQIAGIQKMTAKVAADAQDQKVDDKAGFTQLQTKLDATINTQDFSTLTSEIKSELKEAKSILGDIQKKGGQVTTDQMKRLKELSEKILVGMQPADTEVKWGTLNVKIKDDDTRYKYLQEHTNAFLTPDGGKPEPGEIKGKFPGGSPVPTLQSAIYEDLETVRGKFSNPQDLQKGLENGFGKKLSDEDAKVLFDFIEKGSIGGSGTVTKDDVGKLQKILGSISPHFEQRLAKNGNYDSKYGYATTEEVRLLAAQMAKKVPDPVVEKQVEKKIEIQQTAQTQTVQKDSFDKYDEVMIVMDKSPSMNADRQAVASEVDQLIKSKNSDTKVGLVFFEDTNQVKVKSKLGDNDRAGVIDALLNEKPKEKNPDESGINGALKALKQGGFSDDPGKTRLLRVYTDEAEHDVTPEKLKEIKELAEKKGIKVEFMVRGAKKNDPVKVIQLDDVIRSVRMEDADKHDMKKMSITSGYLNWLSPKIPGKMIPSN